MVTADGHNKAATMTDDSEFDEDGWDEAYAELINGLQEADLCETPAPPQLMRSDVKDHGGGSERNRRR